MKTTIIGLGLMGGSMALTLKQKGFSKYIIGIDKNKSHCEEAIKLNIVNEIRKLNDLNDSDVFIVATPVEISFHIIYEVLNNISKNQVVIDLGSTKGELCKHLKAHENRSQFVAAHPIAGTENSGPNAAFDSLYNGKKVVICEKKLCSDNALSLATELFNKINMTTVFMTPKEHDKHLAYISHLSHVSSFALGLTVLDLEKDEENIFNLAGSGFSSTARLAKSSPEMWKSILSQNKKHIIPALNTYIKYLQSFKNDISTNNEAELHRKMSNANNIRKIIN